MLYTALVAGDEVIGNKTSTRLSPDGHETNWMFIWDLRYVSTATKSTGESSDSKMFPDLHVGTQMYPTSSEVNEPYVRRMGVAAPHSLDRGKGGDRGAQEAGTGPDLRCWTDRRRNSDRVGRLHETNDAMRGGEYRRQLYRARTTSYPFR